MFTYFRVFFLLALPCHLYAQSSVLDRYVEAGLAQNLALQQQNLSLEKSLHALKEARGLYLPKLDLEARYSRAGGGRLIEFPAGDIVNPVYATLNDLLESQGQPPRFPTDLQNEVIPFLREQEQEARLRLIQPVFQPRALHNYRLQKSAHRAEKARREVFSRQLVREIKHAYFRHLSARQLLALLEKTRELLQENLRVSTSLFDNQKATQEVVFRARAELSDLQQQITEAENGVRLSVRYFNFLLNRPFDASIEIVPETELDFDQPLQLPALVENAQAQREEYRQLENNIDVAAQAAKLAGAAYLPSLNLVVDYGMQGENYNLDGDSDFWMATIALQWNLFNGFQDQARRQQARLDRQALQVKRDELDRLVRMQVLEAYDNVQAARETITAAEARAASAQESFRIIARKYAEGLAPQIEYLDARTNLTSAEINAIVAKYDYQIKYGELERVAALYALPENP